MMKLVGTFFLSFICLIAIGQQNNTAALSSLFAHDGTYNRITVPGEKLPPRITSGFNEIHAKLVSDFNSSTIGRPPASILQFSFILTDATTARLMIGFTLASDTKDKKTSYLAFIDYDYTISGDVITLSAGKAPNQTWKNRVMEVTAVQHYFDSQSFKIDWVANASGKKILGGLYRVDDPGNFFYGRLTKVKAGAK